MVNLSKRDWQVIFEKLPSQKLPLLWCGAPHRDGRAVIDVKLEPAWNGDITSSDSMALSYAVYSPEVLHGRVEEMNVVMKELGLERIDMNANGNYQYKSIAEAYRRSDAD